MITGEGWVVLGHSPILILVDCIYSGNLMIKHLIIEYWHPRYGIKMYVLGNIYWRHIHKHKHNYHTRAQDGIFERGGYLKMEVYEKLVIVLIFVLTPI